ncbi:GatB/YqeY domain-containing protein [Coxiella-like endosymbiont]|uniref:GatB/YqeY domain-containing protein n=1 Tax=Coxiella-like endosymbiont TaxID=1592897 RepID=UPI00272D03C1|nr:GatB/YqeY domain-containing protein [Coxiella-like endosymbiont]
MKTAMRAQEKDRLSTIRLLIAAIKQREIDNPKGRDGNGLEESDAIKVIKKIIKQRREFIRQYESSNRPDLAEKEQHEIEILESYLPDIISETEIDTLIQKAIEETQESSIKDMGKRV